MSPAEMIAEANRRDRRRAEGKPLEPTPDELAGDKRLRDADERLEKDIQRDVRKFYIAHGCTVWNLSQARATKQTAGLSDMYITHPRCKRAWWHETKTPSGKLSPAQVVFVEENAICGVTVVVGGMIAADVWLKQIGVILTGNSPRAETDGSR